MRFFLLSFHHKFYFTLFLITLILLHLERAQSAPQTQQYVDSQEFLAQIEEYYSSDDGEGVSEAKRGNTEIHSSVSDVGNNEEHNTGNLGCFNCQGSEINYQPYAQQGNIIDQTQVHNHHHHY